jgi:hypothetical protein
MTSSMLSLVAAQPGPASWCAGGSGHDWREDLLRLPDGFGDEPEPVQDSQAGYDSQAIEDDLDVEREAWEIDRDHFHRMLAAPLTTPDPVVRRNIVRESNLAVEEAMKASRALDKGVKSCDEAGDVAGEPDEILSILEGGESQNAGSESKNAGGESHNAGGESQSAGVAPVTPPHKGPRTPPKTFLMDRTEFLASSDDSDDEQTPWWRRRSPTPPVRSIEISPETDFPRRYPPAQMRPRRTSSSTTGTQIQRERSRSRT